MDATTLAYLAGAMDSDGHFSIKRNTYSMRVVGDSSQPSYSERVGIKQVTPHIPELLKKTFGGALSHEKASTRNGRPLIGWNATDKIAAKCVRSLLPYLRIKRRQAELLLELRATKDDSRHQQLSYWFQRENPDWKKLPMLTSLEVVDRLNYANISIVSQAVGNGTLLAIPSDHNGRHKPRFPEAFVELLAAHQASSKDLRGRTRPAQLIAWRERLWDEVRVLNKIGTGDHPISMRSGTYTPK